jgi:hypothetical protein
MILNMVEDQPWIPMFYLKTLLEGRTRDHSKRKRLDRMGFEQASIHLKLMGLECTG